MSAGSVACHAMHELEQKLEQVFSRIEQQRMRDVPVCNPALQVRAVGFREWGEDYLGVMLTPWFMNLMLLPKAPEQLADAVIGSKQLQPFPSGRYEFIVGEEEALGRYRACSLFSPVFEFADQDTALAVAASVLEGLMDSGNQDGVSTRQGEITRIWRGEKEAGDAAALAVQDVQEKPTGPRLEQPMSRRDFLRGGRHGRVKQNAAGNGSGPGDDA